MSLPKTAHKLEALIQQFHFGRLSDSINSIAAETSSSRFGKAISACDATAAAST